MFLAGVVCLAAWQVWLTLRLMEQDRNIELQRSRERVGEIADLAMANLARKLGDWSLQLRDLRPFSLFDPSALRVPQGSTIVQITVGSIRSYPARQLLFTPELPASQVVADNRLDTADEMEFQTRQYDQAIDVLRPLAKNPALRPEALLRIARLEHKDGRLEEALETYSSLTNEASTNSSGTPYAVLALAARCRIFKEASRSDDLVREEGMLYHGMLDSRWPMRYETFEHYWSELNSLGFPTGNPPQPDLVFAETVSTLDDKWRPVRQQGAIQDTGRLIQSDSTILLWNARSDRLAALIIPGTWLNSGLELPEDSEDIRWKVSFGRAPAARISQFTRSLADAGLTGWIDFSSTRPMSVAASSRHALWLAGVALMLAVVLGSGYTLQRAITQELRVARLQSDFVAAVSHEFRSPLTTLRSMTELLTHDRITDESRRRQSYLFLDRETNRLQRLVEDLLDFGRMESGRKQFRFRTYDASQLVQAAVDDVREQAESRGFQIETNFASGQASIWADEEAIRRAVRNLIENAMKYSPVSRTVWVDVMTCDDWVSISVRDRGMGIAPSERRMIFQKFVRGDAAKKAGIKGTGIGLAMVRQISDAMGGEVRVDSELGIGSTFIILLPLAEH